MNNGLSMRAKRYNFDGRTGAILRLAMASKPVGDILSPSNSGAGFSSGSNLTRSCCERIGEADISCGMGSVKVLTRTIFVATAVWYSFALGWAFSSARGQRTVRNCSVRDRSSLTRHAVKFMSKRKASYGPVDVEAFYAETITGSGGAPQGLERDLITRFFGDGDFHGHGDHEAALKNFRECLEKGEPFVGSDDGNGWIWAVADLTVQDGLSLELRKSVPYGLRALLVAKQGAVGEMFEKLNWGVVRRRLNELLGQRDAEGNTIPGYQPP
ncbi:unnamed protein product [Durusdinium trenchii]|uniref:SnoaL-like domain-containing protein n=2 Tax=Durusdinium trenchii TaxID=1381693 RepID=A0ABP0R388_9DINO